MLTNPDIVPSGSINRWILLILMFQFDLVHVPGAFYGPDGLSQRQKQLDDLSVEEDDFDNWIYQVHGFLHFILSTLTQKFEQPPTTLYVLDTPSNTLDNLPMNPENKDNKLVNSEKKTDSYLIIP